MSARPRRGSGSTATGDGTWRREVACCFGEGPPVTIEGRQLQPFVSRFGLPRQAFDDLIDGVEMDLGSRRYRTFAELRYRTLRSWSCERRVIGKAEITNGQDNPRFIVTSLTGKEQWAAAPAMFRDGRSLYEEFYCARGDMENRIKEQQLDLFGDRTSTAFLASNQLRLWFSTFAYLLLRGLRACALKGTRLATATAGSLRLHLLKIGALITVSVRRVYVRMSSAFALADVFAQAHRRLRAAPAG